MAVLFQLGEHLLVPVFAVLRLQHLVSLVGEIDHLGRNAQPLERRPVAMANKLVITVAIKVDSLMSRSLW
jgi:hypothetical protein